MKSHFALAVVLLSVLSVTFCDDSTEESVHFVEEQPGSKNFRHDSEESEESNHNYIINPLCPGGINCNIGARPCFGPGCTTFLRPGSTILRPTTTILRPTTTILRPTTTILRPTTTFIRPGTSFIRPCSGFGCSTSTFLRPGCTGLGCSRVWAHDSEEESQEQ